MALNRTKVLETAQKYLAKGQYDRAIAEYQKLVEEDPKDVRTWLKIGDLYTRKGARPQACETYARVARQYADQGFFLKAVAVYKQILKLDPNRLEVSLNLAEMYEQLQLVSDALSTYEQVAAQYARAGDVDAALDTLGRMADLDPENIPVRIKYAEALSKAGRTEEAADSFEIGANLLKDQGRIDDYIKVAERLLYHRPTDVAVARELSQLYIDRNDAKRALGKLQICFKADPRDVTTLELLARAFELLGQLPKTISVYREVARLHQEAGRAEDRALILKRILELDPSDAEARQALASYAPRDEPEVLDTDDAVELIDDDVELIEDDALLEADDDDAELLVVDDEEPAPQRVETPEASEIPIDVSSGQSAPAMQATQHEETTAEPSIPPDVAREAQIARLLTECEVFLRYGLKAKVIEQLKKVLDIAPAHVEARERLKDAYLAQNKLDEAIRELYELAALFEDDNPDLATSYFQQILELDPASEPARMNVQAMTSFDDKTEGDDDAVMFIEEEEEAPPAAPAVEADPDVITMDEVVPIEEGAPAYVMSDPAEQDEVFTAPPPDALAPMSPEEFEAAPLRPSTPGDVEAARERMSMPPGEVEEILEEAEFFVAQGLLSEARGTLEDALKSFPNHPILMDKIGELAELEAAQKSSAGDAAAEDEDESFLLAEKLAEELGPDDSATDAGSDVLDVESVFEQFKKGVEEQIGLEDTDTHFDLGIAYKEMGLLDDAIHEFGLSKGNPQRECIAYTMMGLCYVEKGDISEAIVHFKKGLYADHKSEREELGLYFELGAAYELLHDPKEALYYYQKVQKRAGNFRNVGEKIKQLAAPKPKAPSKGPPPSIEDVDRAFDDLMGDD